MYHIKTMNKISKVGLAQLDDRFAISDTMEQEDAILVRSAKLHDYDFPAQLQCIARAGAGVNNIPLDRAADSGIVVFNTPGANANGVKELTLAALLLSSRKIAQGVTWVKEQSAAGEDIAAVVEKGKSAYAGPELLGKTLGLVGLGAIGVLVANIATKLGMNVYGYDPFLSVNAALNLSRMVHVAPDLETIYKNCDYISIHVPMGKETKGMINEDAFHMMKGGVRIINLARGGLVNEEDMVKALQSGKVAAYVTDFPTNVLAGCKNVTLIPHLGASTPESEENCAVMAAQQLRDYLENGNIRNSVNLPTLEQPWSGIARICLIHKNSPGMLAQITALLSEEGVNVENMTNKSKGEYAYTVVDIGSRITDKEIEELRAIEGMLRVRYLTH